MTGMRELAARLRKKAEEMETAGVIAGRLQRDASICEDACVEHADLERQAASAIDSLSSQVAELREALRPFADYAAFALEKEPDLWSKCTKGGARD